MITFTLIKCLHLSSWFYLGLILEYFIGGYLVLVVYLLSRFKVVKAFNEWGVMRGILTAFVITFCSFYSPIAAVFVFVVSWGEWSGRRCAKKKLGI